MSFVRHSSIVPRPIGKARARTQNMFQRLWARGHKNAAVVALTSSSLSSSSPSGTKEMQFSTPRKSAGSSAVAIKQRQQAHTHSVDLVCLVCLQLMTSKRSPKLLSCGHSACAECLLTLPAASNAQAIQCPVCVQ